MPHAPRLGVLLVALGALAPAVMGCNLTQTGEPPPPGRLNFPIALELVNVDGGEADFLVVANSNFDLRYNTGTLLSLRLDAIRERVRAADMSPCTEGDEDDCFLDGTGALSSAYLAGEIAVGSHVDGMAPSSDGTRLYLALRSEETLAMVDFAANGTLGCDEEDSDGDVMRCGDTYLHLGEDDVESERGLTLSGDPVDVVTFPLSAVGGATDAGDAIVVALRDGRIGLFLEQPGAIVPAENGGESVNRPTLVHVAEGFPSGVTCGNLPFCRLVGMALQPEAGTVWVTSQDTDRIGRAGITLDTGNPSRSFLYDAGSRRVGGIDDGNDIRDMVFDPDAPGRAFVLSRRPESVVSVDVDRTGLTSVDVALDDVWEVGRGPSRMALATLGETDPRRYVFVSCFDAQKVFVIDVDSGALVAVIGGLSGPFELTVDEAAQELWVVDFSTSVIRMYDLAPLADNVPPVLLATIGEPFAPSGI